MKVQIPIYCPCSSSCNMFLAYFMVTFLHRCTKQGCHSIDTIVWQGCVGVSFTYFCALLETRINWYWHNLRWRANYFRNFFWIRFRNYFWIPASLLFLLFLLLCFPAFPASLLFCFFAFLLLLLLAFSAFLLFCFSCFSALLLFLLLCFSAFPASLPFCCFAFVRFLFLCFSAFLLLCFFFWVLPALNTWFSCKMHFSQYLHPWVSHDQPSLEN